VKYTPTTPIAFPGPRKTGGMTGDLQRANAEDKLTLGIFVNNRSVTGVIPGGYANLASKIAAGDSIIAVDGAPVTEETFMAHIKKTRDAVGTKVKVVVDRKGVVQETVLIKQRALYVTQAEKTMNALTALRSATSAATCKSLTNEITALLVTVAENEAAVCEKLVALQKQANNGAQATNGSSAPSPAPAPPSADAADKQREIETLKKQLVSMTQRAAGAEEGVKKCEQAAESLKRELASATEDLAAATKATADKTKEVETHTHTHKAGRKEVEALQTEVATLKGELAEALKGKTSNASSREEQLATSAQQLSRELETAKAQVLKLTTANNLAEKELSSTKMALDMAQGAAKAAPAASSDPSANGNGAAAADKAAAEKEVNKAAMTAKLAQSLAEKVKVLEAQLAAASPVGPASTPLAVSAAAPSAEQPVPAPAAPEEPAADATQKKKKKSKK